MKWMNRLPFKQPPRVMLLWFQRTTFKRTHSPEQQCSPSVFHFFFFKKHVQIRWMSALRCPILLGWKTQRSPSPLPWRPVQSGLHWRRLFIVVAHVLDSMWNYCELIKLPQISCSRTANPRVSILRVDQVRVQGLNSEFVEPALRNGPLVDILFPCVEDRW